MRIGVDFDNTIVNTFQVSKKYLDMYMPKNTLKSYHELAKDKEIDFFSKNSISITNDLSINKGFKKFLSFCKKNDIKVILISKRGYNFEPLVEATYKFLEKNNIHFDEVYCKITSKGEFCKLNDIDLMIDDLDIELKKVEDYGIRVLKYGSKSDKYEYALSWNEVLEFIQKGLK